MHVFASFDLQILPVEKIKISGISPPVFYGRSVFTTLAVFSGQPFLWEKHWRRLQETAEKIGIDPAIFTETRVKQALSELIEKNNVRDARVRLTVLDASSNGLWSSAVQKQTHFLMTTADLRTVEGVSGLTIAPFPINSKSPLSGLKTGNYLENLLIFEKARENGFDEAVRLNENGKIVSAALANLFWIKGGTIFTPSLKTGCLNGTTREFLLENFEVLQVESGLDEIRAADEIFLTSSGLGVQPAVFENHSHKEFPTVSRLQNFYRQEIKNLSIAKS